MARRFWQASSCDNLASEIRSRAGCADGAMVLPVGEGISISSELKKFDGGRFGRMRGTGNSQQPGITFRARSHRDGVGNGPISDIGVHRDSVGGWRSVSTRRMKFLDCACCRQMVLIESAK